MSVFVFTSEWLGQVPACLLGVTEMLVPVLALLCLLHYVLGVKGELFRKLLHAVAFCFPVGLVLNAPCWQTAAFLCILIPALVYPLLMLWEKRPGFGDFFCQRAPGEVRSSLLQLFLTAAFMISLLWGRLNKSYIEIISVLMWGFGDAAAGLIGRRMGKRSLKLPFADTHKSVEGSLAMLLVSWVIGFGCMLALRTVRPVSAALAALFTAAAGCYAEMISKRGYDTVIVPLANAAVLLLIKI